MHSNGSPSQPKANLAELQRTQGSLIASVSGLSTQFEYMSRVSSTESPVLSPGFQRALPLPVRSQADSSSLDEKLGSVSGSTMLRFTCGRRAGAVALSSATIGKPALVRSI